MINIADDILHLQQTGLLGQMLIDRTTRSNILWASDEFSFLGPKFQKDGEIQPKLITGAYSGVIRTRVQKSKGQKSDRTKKHGEVFTPLWICKKMIDYADEEWFGKAAVFEKEKVEFPVNKDWKEYVDSRRLEITCGEAPYLVSRYDVETGEEIELEQRIGIFDRKMRVVNENAGTDEEWLKWAFRALEATYGYEFQGDSLLIARINLFISFEEYLCKKLNREPSKQEYGRMVKTITWNLWQMNGLTGMVPYAKTQEPQQLTIDDYLSDHFKHSEENKSECRIFDWRRGASLTYLGMKQEGTGK